MKIWGSRRGALALAASFLVPSLAAGVAYAGGATPMPAALTFPATGTGSQSKSMNVQFVNTSNAQITIDSITVGGANPMDFVVVMPPGLPTGLVPGAGLPVDVAFAPTNGGARSATLQAQVRGEMATTNVTLTGTGVGPKITVTPSPILAGGVPFGQMVPPAAVKVSNEGGAPVTVNSIALSGGDAARFGLTGLPNLPTTLSPAQSFSINVTFSPQQAGSLMTSLVVSSTDPMTPVLTTAVTGYSGNPKVSVDLGTIIFGNQRVAQPSAGQDLVISNTGLSDLHISNVSVAGNNPGDFVLSGLPKFPLVLQVGQSQKVTAVFNPTQAGPRAAVIAIASDDPNTPTRNVSLQGVGTTPGAMVSPLMIDFGAVKVGATGTASVSIKNSGTGPVLVSALSFVGADAASFTGSLAAPFSIAAGATTVVQLQFKPKKVASFTAAMNLTTDDPNVPMASVMLKGSSTSPMLSVTPTMLDFGGIVVGKSAPAQAFTVKNGGNQVMTVSTFSLAGVRPTSYTLSPSMKVPFTIAAGASQDFMVTYTAHLNSDEDAQVTIVVDDPMMPSAIVKLTGHGLQANIKTLPNDKDVMDFKVVPVGITGKPQPVRIDNTGDAPLEIKTVKATGMDGGFAVDKPGPFTVDPGKSATVSVSFTPLMAMTYTATLEITPADDAIPPVTIDLIGVGQAPMISATNDVGMSSIDFGQVALSTPSMGQTVKIHNSATYPQNINVGADPAVFALVPPEVTTAMVPAGGTVSFTIRFTPVAAMAYAGKVSVTVPGGSVPLATVALKGEGIDDGSNNNNGGGDTGGGCSVTGRGRAGGLALVGLLIGIGMVVRRRRAGSR